MLIPLESVLAGERTHWLPRVTPRITHSTNHPLTSLEKSAILRDLPGREFHSFVSHKKRNQHFEIIFIPFAGDGEIVR